MTANIVEPKGEPPPKDGVPPPLVHKRGYKWKGVTKGDPTRQKSAGLRKRGGKGASRSKKGPPTQEGHCSQTEKNEERKKEGGCTELGPTKKERPLLTRT